MLRLVTLAATVALAAAQNVPAIMAEDLDLVLSVPQGGSLKIRSPGGADAELYGGTDTSDLLSTVNTLTNTVQMLATQLSTLQSYKGSVESCANAGQLYDSADNVCVDPASAAATTDLAQRVTANEDDIDMLENNLNGTNGDHQYCSICQRNFYAAEPCNDDAQTVCQACPAATYSRGGHPTACTTCASQIANCAVASCTDRSDAQCTSCDPTVAATGQQAFIVSGNRCTRCPAGQYRGTNTSCTLCPKPDTCAVTSCQAVVRGGSAVPVTGTGRLSAIYTTMGLSNAAYFGLATDGVTTWAGGGQIHSANMQNPWYSYDMGAGVGTAIDRMVLWNRGAGHACRLFVPQPLCNMANAAQRTGTPLEQDFGFYVGLTDQPLTADTITAPSTTPCRNPGDRNCVCGGGKIVNPNITNVYELDCSGATGRYAYIFLPSPAARGGVDNMILNFNEFVVHGRYAPGQPAVSVCDTPCTLAGCTPAEARCAGGIGTAVCNPGRCIDEVIGGVAWGYDASTRTCVRCITGSQYLGSDGTCQDCPAGCSNCQVTDSLISGGIPSHGPGQYNNAAPGRALDGDLTTHSETATTLNPFFQLEFANPEAVASVIVNNRLGNCAARLFQSSVACSWQYPTGDNDREYNGPGEGAVVRVSNEPCDPTRTQECPGEVCGYITRSISVGDPSAPYEVTCDSPIVGQYVTLQLPTNGPSRILHIAEFAARVDVNSPQC